MILKISDYKTREELEAKAKELEGSDDVTIEGTASELREFNLSGSTKVWGIRCVETDSEKKPEIEVQKPDRGEIYKHGINLDKK